MGLEAEIRDRLEQTFHPESLEILNESALHAGHAGDDGSGESHWRIRITAEGFRDLGRVERHRRVHAALGPELIARIHALALEIR